MPQWLHDQQQHCSFKIFVQMFNFKIGLDPALEMAGGLETYGPEGEWAFLPVAAGFFLG